MVKVVTLELNGDFEKGFHAKLKVGEAGELPSGSDKSILPNNQQILQAYKHWRKQYSEMGYRWRELRLLNCPTNLSDTEDCKKAAENLKNELNRWLNSKDFLNCFDNIFDESEKFEEIRLIIENNEIDLLRKLPWHLWNRIQDLNIEVALSSPKYNKPKRTKRLMAQPRILAILGDSEGLNIDEDRKLLGQLAEKRNADIEFLTEPKLSQISKQLEDKNGWDILFFAGHGSSDYSSGTGKIYINKEETLEINQLNKALKTSIDQGLRLAIFNSCEGLGLVKELENLDIPQVIVMKEPVPDKVAQKFLEYFLEEFTNGESLYSSVRKARNNLQDLEKDFPCATWNPVICQNPAEMPLTWEELTPPKLAYVWNILEDLLNGILSSEETPKTESEQPKEDVVAPGQPDVVELTRVRDFWTRELSKGQFVSLEGALSQYAPMFIGLPMLKRDVHREYRRAIPLADVKYMKENKTAIDANLAFTAGQMVLRLDPQELKVDWVYMGLYHSIVRNSIPVFVDKDYYSNAVEPFFEQEGNRIAYVIEAKVTGRLIPFPGDFLQEYIEKNNIQGYIRPELISEAEKEILAIFVDGHNTSIEYLEPAKYLDGDIWVAYESGVEQFFVSRFIDLSDVEDVRQESRALATEARELYPDGELMYQFDQVERLIQGYQTVDSIIERLKRRPPRES